MIVKEQPGDVLDGTSMSAVEWPEEQATIQLFYQRNDGAVVHAIYSEGEWRQIPEEERVVTKDARMGTNLAAIVRTTDGIRLVRIGHGILFHGTGLISSQTHLFYIDVEGTLREIIHSTNNTRSIWTEGTFNSRTLGFQPNSKRSTLAAAYHPSLILNSDHERLRGIGASETIILLTGTNQAMGVGRYYAWTPETGWIHFRNVTINTRAGASILYTARPNEPTKAIENVWSQLHMGKSLNHWSFNHTAEPIPEPEPEPEPLPDEEESSVSTMSDILGINLDDEPRSSPKPPTTSPVADWPPNNSTGDSGNKDGKHVEAVHGMFQASSVAGLTLPVPAHGADTYLYLQSGGWGDLIELRYNGHGDKAKVQGSNIITTHMRKEGGIAAAKCRITRDGSWEINLFFQMKSKKGKQNEKGEIAHYVKRVGERSFWQWHRREYVSLF